MNDKYLRLQESGQAMTRANRTGTKRAPSPFCGAVVLAASLLALGVASSALAAQSGEESFASPEQAVQALAAAWHSGRTSELLAIFGPAGRPLVISGDPIAESNARHRFSVAFDQRHQIERDGGGEAILVIGDEAWPYPIPIVRLGAAWRFDVKAGAEQVLDRRVGADELNAIAVARGYVEAQRDYAAQDRMGDGLHEYAQQVASTEGKHDGLYWPAAPGATNESPLGPLVAAAEAKGYPPPPATAGGRGPLEGYYFRILTGQGGHTPGGAKSYIVGGHMTGGFALIAFPAKWGDSGVMTFVVNQNGIVFEKNLGPDSTKLARQVTLYDPDRSWRIASPSSPQP